MNTKSQRRILVIQSNPAADSYSAALADAYVEGAAVSGAEVQVLRLAELEFDPNLIGGYRSQQSLESDLLRAQELITWADHLVFVYPTWWGTVPALLKGFIDRIFLPGFAFKFRKGSPLPEQLLKGKTARLIVTMDSPSFYYRFVLGSPGHKMMKLSVLKFCGIQPIRETTIYQFRKLSEEKRGEWLIRVRKLGEQGE